MDNGISIRPQDEHNRALVDLTHPADWQNPTPDGRYNMVVIGGGTAGLVTAAASAGLGARVALIERHLLGGDCLNFGCVPSKALIRSAHAAADVREAAALGVHVGDARVDFAAVMERLRRLRTSIAHHDSAARFQGLGVDVYLGSAEFTGSDRVRVGEAELTFKRACIATGARAFTPPIEGLEEAGYLTNETVFELEELPQRVAVVGGGPIGCELAQSFARLGATVTVVEMMPRVLPRDDENASRTVASSLERDGVDLQLGAKLARVTGGSRGEKILELEDERSQNRVTVDEIVVAIGRAPNVSGMGLNHAGVEHDARLGVVVDDRLRTTNKRIFAAGDVATELRFTHMADAMARIVVQNALFPGRAKASTLTVPWATYTDPEVAQVGHTESTAREKGIEYDVYEQGFDGVDRAILDGDTEGFAKVLVRRGKDQIIGATVVAPGAGDLIGEMSLAMTHEIGLGKLSKTVHPYPTKAEVFRKLGDAYSRSRLTPSVQRWMTRWMRFTR